MKKDNPTCSGVRKKVLRFQKGLECLPKNGPAYTWWKFRIRDGRNYSCWICRTARCSAVAAARQRRMKFEHPVLFSVVVPAYNTPECFLREMIRSVLAQTYTNWELCIADASDEKHSYVEQICMEYTRKERRIRYQKLDGNLGISGNTNACLEMAKGDFIALLDHDDVLHRAALYEVAEALGRRDTDLIYTDEALFLSPDIRRIFYIHYKPDFAPDTLRSQNYFCHLTVFRRTLLEKTGGFRSEYDGSQDHDMMLRIAARTDRIQHIPKVLYFWRVHDQSSANNAESKPFAYEAGCRAVMDSLRAAGISGQTVCTRFPGFYRTIYEIRGNPLVSIIIPNCDHAGKLEKCLRSIEEKSSYCNREIIVVENNSKDPRTFRLYQDIQRRWADVSVVAYPDRGEFNHSAINNYAVRTAAHGSFFLFLNNDTEVITGNWIEEMLMYAQRPDVGAVGAMLYYPDDTVQHAGVILGMGGPAGHCFLRKPREYYAYCGRMQHVQNLSAVSAACMMTRREVFDQVGGFDEIFPTAYNDTDLCLSIRESGYLIVWTPFAELYHCESASRGYDLIPEKEEQRKKYGDMLKNRWHKVFERGDPYFNPNLSLYTNDFSPAWKYYEPNRRRVKGSER